MNKTGLFVGCAAGMMLLVAPPTLARTGCPQFLVASGYAELCSPGAWLPYEHQNHEHEHVLKRRHLGDKDAPKANHPANTKIRLRHFGKK